MCNTKDRQDLKRNCSGILDTPRDLSILKGFPDISQQLTSIFDKSLKELIGEKYKFVGLDQIGLHLRSTTCTEGDEPTPLMNEEAVRLYPRGKYCREHKFPGEGHSVAAAKNHGRGGRCKSSCADNFTERHSKGRSLT